MTITMRQADLTRELADKLQQIFQETQDPEKRFEKTEYAVYNWQTEHAVELAQGTTATDLGTMITRAQLYASFQTNQF